MIADSLVPSTELEVGDQVEVEIEGYYYPGELSSKVDRSGDVYFTIKFTKACGWSAVSVELRFLTS